MAGTIDISLLGDKALTRKLNKLPNRVQKKVVRQSMRKAAKPLLTLIKQAIGEIRVTGIHTDPLKRGMKIKSVKRSRTRVGVEIVTPRRQELDIADSDKSYWPANIELGTSKSPPRKFIRDTVDSNRIQTMNIIQRELASGIIREAKKK